MTAEQERAAVVAKGQRDAVVSAYLKTRFSLGFRLYVAWDVLTKPAIACATISRLGHDLAVREHLLGSKTDD